MEIENETNKPACPENHLTKSILVTVCCCVAFGIVAIAKSSQVNSFYAMGKYEEAQKTSEEANKWGNYALYTGVAFGLIYLVFMVISLLHTATHAGALGR